METVQALQNKIQLLELEVQRLRKLEGTAKIIHDEQLDYQDSQIRFRTIFECSKLANKIIASDFSILEVNTAFLNLLGYSREELIGKKNLDYTPVEYHSDWQLLQLLYKSIRLRSKRKCN